MKKKGVSDRREERMTACNFWGFVLLIRTVWNCLADFFVLYTEGVGFTNVMTFVLKTIGKCRKIDGIAPFCKEK